MKIHLKQLSNFYFFLLPAEPSGLVEKAKFKAWSDRKGMSQDDAKKQYVEMAEKLQSKYA